MNSSRRYRIAVVSEDLAAPWDEGIKKFAFSVARAFKNDHDVIVINVDRSGVGATEDIVQVPGTRTFMNGALKRTIRAHRPDWVLYVPSPSNTLSSNIRASMLARHAKTPVIMVGLIPRWHEGWRRHVARMFAPAITLVPSYASLLRLTRQGAAGDVIPVGVELGDLRSGDDRHALRDKLGIRHDAYVFLHVGHTRPRRNVVALTALAGDSDTEIISISSTSTPEDSDVRSELDKAGIRVIREFVNVGEFYRAADCYVFPVHDSEGCVEMPLSVLEALACGLPVLTTPFGGLPDFFEEGDDLRYWRDEDELVNAANRMRANPPTATRAMDDFTWDRIAERILHHAEAL